MANPRNANHIDAHIGRYLRKSRKRANLTQTELADALGITFQQIQKYERGANRVSASRLWDICKVLNKMPNDFFQIDNNGENDNGPDSPLSVNL
mgnify:CR=1 FL=1